MTHYMDCVSHRLVPKWAILKDKRNSSSSFIPSPLVDSPTLTPYNGGEDRTVETLADDEHYRDLLCEQLSDDAIHERLSPIGFADWRAAYGCLQRMAGDSQQKLALADVLPHLLMTLAGAASPDRALVNLERFAGSAPDRLALFYYLASNPRAVEILVTLFAGSQFLTEILLRHPEYFSRLMEHKHLVRLKSTGQFYVEAQAAVTPPGEVARQLDALRRFQRLELMRIGACELLDLFDLPAVTLQLSNLADSLVQVCLGIASEQTGTSLDHFAVIAMGKLGGQELNYSSDIDLLFLAESDAFAYRRLGERLIEALASVTAEGFLRSMGIWRIWTGTRACGKSKPSSKRGPLRATQRWGTSFYNGPTRCCSTRAPKRCANKCM
jgi:glutamine synthetase adenylyltransferase